MEQNNRSEELQREKSPRYTRMTSFVNSRCCCYAFFIIVLISWHLLASPGAADDAVWSKIIGDFTGFSDYLSFLWNRWTTWSSRLMIESVLIVIAGGPWFVWVMLDILFFLLLLTSLESLLNIKNEDPSKLWLLITLILQYPFTHMSTAGWVATTINYLWPLACCLFGISVVQRVMNHESIPSATKGIGLAALLFGANHEQMGMIALALLIIVCIRMMSKGHRVSPYIIICTATVAIEFALELLCPGNATRLSHEITARMPDFAQMGLFHKADMGLVHLSNWIFTDMNLVVLALLVGFVIIFWRRGQNSALLIIAIALTCTYLGQSLIVEMYPLTEVALHPLEDLSTASGFTAKNMIATAIDIAFFTMLPIMIYHALPTAPRRGAGILIYGLGMLSALALGFSPTVYVSSNRVFIFLFFALCILAFMVLQTALKNLERYSALGLYAMIAASTIASANTAYLIFLLR